MEDEELGALSTVTDAESEAMPGMTGNPQALAVLNSIRAEQKKRYDDYAARIRAARAAQQQPAQSDMSRLASALMAAGAPNAARSNWVALQQGVQNWNQSGEAQKAAEMKQQQLAAAEEAELAKAAFEQGASMETLAAKYALAPQKSGWSASGNISPLGEPYATYRGADGRVVIKTRAGETAFDAPGAPAGGAPMGGVASEGGGNALPGGTAVGPDGVFIGPDGKRYRYDAFRIPREVFGGDTRPATPEEARRFGATEGSFENGVFKPGAGSVPLSQLQSEIASGEGKLQHMQEMISLAADLKSRVGPLTAGPVGAVAGFIPGTSAFTLKEEMVKTLGGNIAFDRLQQMREESKTGGALGQVAVQELDALRGSLGALNSSMNPQDLQRNLDRVIAGYQRAMAAYQRMLDDKQRRLSGGAPAQGTAPRSTPSAGWGKMTVK
jgi:hypothetical protein